MIEIRNAIWSKADWASIDEWARTKTGIEDLSDTMYPSSMIVYFLENTLPITVEHRVCGRTDRTARLSMNLRLKEGTKRNIYRAGPRLPTRCLNWSQWVTVNHTLNFLLERIHLSCTVSALNGRLVIREGFQSYNHMDWVRQVGYDLIGPAHLERHTALIPCDCGSCKKLDYFG